MRAQTGSFTVIGPEAARLARLLAVTPGGAPLPLQLQYLLVELAPGRQAAALLEAQFETGPATAEFDDAGGVLRFKLPPEALSLQVVSEVGKAIDEATRRADCEMLRCVILAAGASPATAERLAGALQAGPGRRANDPIIDWLRRWSWHLSLIFHQLRDGLNRKEACARVAQLARMKSTASITRVATTKNCKQFARIEYIATTTDNL